VNQPINTSFQANGALTFWTLATAPHRILEPIYNNHKYDEYCPNKRSPSQALTLANSDLAKRVSEVTTSQTTVIPKVMSKKRLTHYEIHLVDPSGQDDKPSDVTPFLTAFRVEYAPEMWTTNIKFHVGIPTVDQQVYADYLLAQFVHYSNQVCHNDIASSLVSILKSECKAVLLRPRGGFYWVPDSSSLRWKQFAGDLTATSYASIYSLTVAKDDELVKAVTSGIESEVKASIKNLIELSSSDDLGTRALKSKEQAALNLKQRVNQIESELGLMDAFQGLQQGCDLAKSIAAEAVLSKMSNI